MGGATVPALWSGVSGLAGGGRDLHLLDALAARWGFEQDGGHTTICSLACRGARYAVMAILPLG
jgi:hypothetical protein